jgi:hypothetical protein
MDRVLMNDGKLTRASHYRPLALHAADDAVGHVGPIGEIGNVSPVGVEDRAVTAFAGLEDVVIPDKPAPAAA